MEPVRQVWGDNKREEVMARTLVQYLDANQVIRDLAEWDIK